MATINVAYTARINAPGISPVLTRAQIWAGLQRKVRHGNEFVPVIKKCEVLEDNGDEVTRQVTFHFKDGIPGREQEKVIEICKSFPPTKINFHRPTGAIISNVVSDGESFSDEELQMTYIFEWPQDDILGGDEKTQELAMEYRKVAKIAVESSIETLRKMAKEGSI